MNTTTNTTPITSAKNNKPFTDLNGLRAAGFWPNGKAPSVRTLRDWTRLRLLPYHKVGHFVFYDVDEVEEFIRTRLKIAPRNVA